MDLDELRLSAIYQSPIAVDASVTTVMGDASLRAIDKTTGEAAAMGGLSLQTVRPMAVVRATELTAAGLEPADVDDGEITINGTAWRIKSHRMKPGIGGELAGEVELLLEGMT